MSVNARKKQQRRGKNPQLHITGTPEQYRRWLEAAAREGRSGSNWGARVLDAYLASFPKTPGSTS